jgi:hypothetical protein
MGTADLAATTQALAGLRKPRSLSIGGNFDRKNKKPPAAIVRLLEIRARESLSLAGTPKGFLGDALLPLLSAVRANDTLPALDVSHNRIGNAVIEAVWAILLEKRSVTEIRIDGSKCTKVEILQRVWEILGGEQNTRVPVPVRRLLRAHSGAAASKRPQLFETFSALQQKAQDRMQAN